MLKFSKIIKICIILLIIFLFVSSNVNATDINMNLELPTTDTNSLDEELTNETPVDSIQDVLSNSLSDETQGSTDVGGDAAPSGVSSIAQENMSFSNILNILIITVGVILILLAIAILIRLKG